MSRRRKVQPAELTAISPATLEKIGDIMENSICVAMVRINSLALACLDGLRMPEQALLEMVIEENQKIADAVSEALGMFPKVQS